MTRAIATRSSRLKGSSKVILLRRRYSRVASMMRSQPRHRSWRQENSWQHSWMTFMSSHRRHEPVACWTPSPTPSSSRPGFNSWAKRVVIMPKAAPRRQACDKPPAERGFVALGVPTGPHESIRSCANARLEEERRLLTQLPQLRICSVPGCCCVCRSSRPASLAHRASGRDSCLCARPR